MTLLDVVRAKKFMTVDGLISSDYYESISGEAIAKLPASATSSSCSSIMVIGGHAGKTILPLLHDSAKSAGTELSSEVIEPLDVRIQNAGTEVVDAKEGKGSATLSMAHAAAVFSRRVIAGLDGADNAQSVCCSYVKSSLIPGLDFFASPVKFGPGGSVEVLPLDIESTLSEYEKKRLNEDVVPQLQGEVAKGLEYIGQF